MKGDSLLAVIKYCYKDHYTEVSNLGKTWADFPCKDVVYGLVRKDRGYSTKTQVLIYIFPQRKRLCRSLVDKALFQ